MCGISGIVRFSGLREDDRVLLARMNEVLTHRGPDHGDEYFDGQIGLGHRRLSIIDLKTGEQPIFNEDHSVVIVFNGEIYNYKELREDLRQAGHTFRTESDTEVIVHLYEEFGEDCLARLNGMFAFALWDDSRKRLFLARDRFGEKPLYYSHRPNGDLLFASELKALRLAPEVGRELNLQALDDYLAYGYVPAPRSIYKDVSKLPAAHYMIVEFGKCKITRYWKPKMGPFSDDPEAVLLEELEELLLDSVRIRLRSDVPVGAFLSGGIDSSLVVAMAASQSTQKLSTFSVGFPEQDFSELKYARVVAEQYDTDHHEVVVESIDESLFPKIVDHFDEPLTDTSVIPTYYLTRETAKHLKVCLSGDGFDELFGGYGLYGLEPMEGVFNRIPGLARANLLGPIARLTPKSFRAKGRLSRFAARDQSIMWQRKCGSFDSIERHELFRPEYRSFVDESAWLYRPHFSDSHAADYRSLRMLADQNTYLSEDILVKVDRNSMWHSLEVRVPALDYRVAELANRIPFCLKRKAGQHKYAVKKIAEKYLPAKHLERPKHGFGLPLTYWMRGKLSGLVHDLLLADSSHCGEYFDREVIAEWVRINDSKKRNVTRRVWALLWLEQWLINESTN